MVINRTSDMPRVNIHDRLFLVDLSSKFPELAQKLENATKANVPFIHLEISLYSDSWEVMRTYSMPFVLESHEGTEIGESVHSLGFYSLGEHRMCGRAFDISFRREDEEWALVFNSKTCI